MPRCMFKVLKNGKVRPRTKSGKKCTFAASTVRRHIKRHGCSGLKCKEHKAHVLRMRDYRARRMQAIRERRGMK